MPRRSPASILALLAAVSACHAAPDSNNGPALVEKRKALASIAQQVILPATANFQQTAIALAAAAEGHASAATAGANDAGEQLVTTQQAWQNAMKAWQALEVMQLGPCGSSTAVIAGENLRDEIYSWPTVNTCTIDRAIVDRSYAASDFFETSLIYGYGLDALEYLLFVHGEGHSCGTQVQLDVGWNALGFAEIERRRAEYAATLSGDISRRAASLLLRWNPEHDDFAGAFAQPGSETSPYDNEMQALDEVFGAMFYIDLFTKDAKLGQAITVNVNCDAPPCPELLETPWAKIGTTAIASNLRALRDLVQGGPDPATADGFDDILLAIDQPQIADSLLFEIDAAIRETESLAQPLQVLVTSDPARVEALYAAIKRVSDDLKGPFVMALRLTVPSEGAGDID